MKILGGKYRGKNIESIPNKAVRPTSSRVKETIFNILMHGRWAKHEQYIDMGKDDVLDGARVVEIFCGTGALGIEAISRGAAHVTFIDQDNRTLALARTNVASLKEERSASFIRSDSAMLPPAGQPCTLAFADPPYNMNLAGRALVSLRDNKWLAHGALMVLEIGSKETFEAPAGFVVLDDRSHDKTRLLIMQYQETAYKRDDNQIASREPAFTNAESTS